MLAHFMFADKRIKAGASSCGVFELVDWYDQHAIRRRNAGYTIPGLANVGRTSDFLGMIAPRPFLMTRGIYEWGNGTEKERVESARHVRDTELLYAEALKYYKAAKTESKLKVIYFDEANGNHCFPPRIKEQVYEWLDSYLKK